MRNFVMTSESVTAGHPDKLCDQISDAVIDAYLAHGTRTPVTAECAIATGIVFLSIRAEQEAPFDPAALARRVAESAGYASFRGKASPTVMLDLSFPPADRGAHRNGLATHLTTSFGYACQHTPDLMPYPIWAAHRLSQALDAARRQGRIAWLQPDAQAQVAVEMRERRPVAIRAIAISGATRQAMPQDQIEHDLASEVIDPAFRSAPVVPDPMTRRVFAVIADEGGPSAHSGLTGRKNADDTYGGFVRHSAAALSGKAPARIDRTAAYAARQMARAVVVAGLASECEVQLSYVIGDEGPVSVELDFFGSGAGQESRIGRRLGEVVDLRVGAIAERMGLWELPGRHDGRFYRDLAVYGHMGRDELAPPWEDVTAIAAALG
ncbi:MULTISPECIES: methionine adenosyltransferase domain-containing protein [unclassified Roseitalea]|uniref:methionine adenosyltransferase domain-containing protein n=1 Tax=unclassified Roseitalea TaxID=2639107 RepID=UPI00273D0EE6|nr:MULTISPECIES: methionine adenosyltransferase domain-containing protein [unclassified Roseitalea]